MLTKARKRFLPPEPGTRMHSARIRFLALGAAMALATTSVHAQQRPMTPDDVLAVRNVSDPQISPDGRWVAYVVSHADLKDNAVDSDIYLIATSCGLSHTGACEPIRLTTSKKPDTSPRWSPDGKLIAFLSSREEKPQIFLISPSGGEAERLTDSKAGVTGFQWSPDGARIAYTAPRDPTPDEERKIKEKDDAIVVDA